MWDSPRALNAVANLLFTLGLAALLAAAALAAAGSSAFALQAVELTAPPRRVTVEQVQAVVAQELRGTFFTVDLEAIRGAFEKLPWVRRASLARRWPATLVVTLEEREVLARWGENALIDRYGERFEAVFEGPLPELSGPDGTEREVVERYLRFRDLLAQAGLGLQAVRLSARGAWELELERGTVVKLGRSHTDQRLARFVVAYGESLGRLGVPVEYVDLRYPHGFAVRLPRETSARTSRGT
ncbi:cell division protein FtsQ/DivIB [Pelomicrobium sp.]|jgi:cell division protein FtsQ|uniref:cell division protein FtsQ/DivIB n=1 Tax=Pelomicrobium sp. TaxID=2815319 RepID=UPI002FDE7ADA